MTSLKTKPIRIRLGKWIDVLLVSDPEQIQWLNSHPSVDRAIDPSASLLHRFIDRRLRGDLGFNGQVLPIFLARSAPGRAERRKELEDLLEDLRGLPGDERDKIGQYVAGQKAGADIGVLVQQWCGRLFFSHYTSTKELYEAGRLLAGWPSALPLRAWKNRVNGRLDKAKNMLVAAAENDLHAIHGTSIGMENVVRSVRKLRRAAMSPAKHQLSPDDVLRECLNAPPAVLRSPTAQVDAPFLERPLTPHTVIVFLVARAYAASGDLDVAFLADGWSRCPAHRVISEMLRAVWHAAHHDETEPKKLLGKINGWSRILQRAVS